MQAKSTGFIAYYRVSTDRQGRSGLGRMLYVNSGYAFSGGAPGNVLLAYSVGGK